VEEGKGDEPASSGAGAGEEEEDAADSAI